MAKTFTQAYTRLMGLINRPTSETAVLAEAKAQINDAINTLQRERAFVRVETVAELAYPASTQYVDLTTVLSGILIRDVKSVQFLNETGTLNGRPLMIKSYSQLQADRMAYSRRDPEWRNSPIYGAATVDTTIEDGYRDDFIAFIAGQKFGLYPAPATAATLLIQYNKWLPELSGDSDTNFLLDYGFDVVILMALRGMQIYMKTDGRYQVTAAEVAEKVASLHAWDSQLKETNITTLK